MPKLQDNRRTETIELKSVEGGQAEIYSSLLARDIEAVANAEKNGTGSMIFPFTLLIKSWNLTDDNDQPLPITKENIGLLGAEDLFAIQNKIDLKDFLKQAASDTLKN